MGKAFYRGTEACVLVYDMTNFESLHAVNTWMSTFEAVESSETKDFPYVIVGNKIDMTEAR